MNQEYIETLNLNPEHRYELVGTKSKDKSSWDIDFYTYEEYDEEGNLVRTFTIEDATRKFPPFNNRISFA